MSIAREMWRTSGAARRTVALAATLGLAACGISKETHQAALDRGTELAKRQQDLESASQRAKADLDAEKAKLAKLADEMGTTQAELQRLIGQLKLTEQQQAERIAALRKFVTGLRKALDRHHIDVHLRNGRLVVDIPEAVLFDSGKADLKKKGMEVIDDMALVIKEAGNRTFRVSGHTDNVPIKTKQFRSNWELSTARAVKVVRYLLEQRLNPLKLAAAGRADNEPIADNATKEGRAQNRRIEFVLEPDLGELPDMSAALTPGQ